MPLYYDTSSPTPGTKNTITRTATDFGIRDFLLHRNIQNPIRYPQLSTSVNGSPRGGEPFLDTMVGSGVVLQQVSLEVDGLLRYDNAIIMNRYKDTDSSAPSIFDIETIPTTPIYPTPPNGTSNYQQQDITQYGILAKSNFGQYRKNNTIKNLYLDAPKQIDMAEFISLQPILTNQQMTSYLDEYGGLNLGNRGLSQAADVIGSFLNGQGVGISSGGLETNFDIRASLAGRVLTATGLLKDTKLGIIGGQQLALALANNAAFNTQQTILGALNVTDNILSLVKDGNTAGFRPDYKITIGSTTGGKILNVTERILGFDVPRSQLQPEGSIFQFENGNVGNIDRANSMILNTGKGQVKALIANFNITLNGTSPDGYDNPTYSPFRSGYAPGYKNNKGEKAINPSGYVFMDSDGNIDNLLFISNNRPIPEISYNRDKMVEEYGFKSPLNSYYFGGDPRDTEIDRVYNAEDFTWTAELTDNPQNLPINAFKGGSKIRQDKKTLLSKTQKLFNSVGMKTIVSNKGDMTIGKPSKTQSAIVMGGMSKGSAVLSKEALSGTTNKANEVFCRSWTSYNRYTHVNNLIRHRGLNQSEQDKTKNIFPSGSHKGGWRQNIEGSVLDDNGFVKIAPYKGDNLTRSATTPKKYMFSIENLAWAGTPAANLLPCEQGPGDLLTGKFGKIMWFPPYNLEFSESSSLNIESTNFIGRGEPIYTYNNTERTGNLSFSVIVDHPSIVNSFAGNNGPSEEFIRSWFAGCVDLDSEWAKKLTEEQKNQPTQQIKKVKQKTITPIKLPSDFNIYFKNDRSDIDSEYESGISFHIDPVTSSRIAGIGDYQADTKYTKGNKNLVWPDSKDFGLNAQKVSILNDDYIGWISPSYFEDLATFMNDKCPECNIKIDGHASAQGYSSINKQLSVDRAQAVKNLLVSYGIPANKVNINTAASVEKYNGNYNKTTTPPDEKGPKTDRYARILFINNEKAKEIDEEPEITDTEQQIGLTSEIKNRFYTECDFFEKLEEDAPFIYESFKEKIRYFSPAFHSTTPEGFNSRLTFLLQCTRQGATISEAGPKNLAFGPAPVCILRIGDFYNTKIIMDNVSFSYEPLVWDLNPEGIGVQPMIANVTISFKYIGGSSLYGPINKLQNALSFNYFANTQTFDPRADTLAVEKSNSGSNTGKQKNDDPIYKLVAGLNPISESMGPLSNSEADKKAVTKEKDSNQITGSDNTVKASNKVPPLTDINRLVLTGVSSTVLNFGQYSSIDFSINRKSPSDNKSLVKNYDLTVKITNNNNNNENWSIKLNNQLTSGDLYQSYTFSMTDMTQVCDGLDLTANSYNFVVTVGDAGSLQYTIPKIGDPATSSTKVPDFVNKTITYSNTVNYSTPNFLDDIHGAASSRNITNDFSEQVGDELKKYDGVAVKDITMQTVYDTTTKNATTKLNCVIYKTTNGLSMKYFDARGAIGTLADSANTLSRMQSQHTEIMNTFKDKKIMKIGDTKQVQIKIEGVDYLYYEAFYQWTD